jgi:hypothetical protein
MCELKGWGVQWENPSEKSWGITRDPLARGGCRGHNQTKHPTAIRGEGEGGVMDEQLEKREGTIARYADDPQQLEAAIAGLSEGYLDMAERDDTWTIR